MINDQSLYFVFNGKKSSDFNVWCSGDGLYRLPERDVEYISVPGRNGDLVVDNGRWQNVAVTYSCFIPKNFREHYADLVSWLASQKGYGKLEDARHPEFYWLARMDADVDPKMVVADDSGTFTLTFNCKPQRFLKSGEIPVEIPCEPAADPVSVRRYWRLTNFSELMQGEITSELTGVFGYTQAEVNAMQFNIITVDDDVLSRLHDMGNVMQTLEVKGYNPDRFFLGLFDDDPTTATGISVRWLASPETGIKAFDLSFKKYLVLQKSLGTEIWFGDEMIAQDENYQFAEVYNPTRFDAVPLIRLTMPHRTYGLEGFTVYMGGINQSGVSLKFDSPMSVYGDDAIVTIDCDTMDTYILPEDNVVHGDFENLNPNAKIYGNRIVLKPGKNVIRLDPMIAGCEILPRWWTI
jgi:predicted phage tail component-like protein